MRRMITRMEDARAQGGAATVMHDRDSSFRVQGRSATYRVELITPHFLVCNCPASVYGNACWHIPAVGLFLVKHPEVAKALGAPVETCRSCGDVFANGIGDTCDACAEVIAL